MRGLSRWLLAAVVLLGCTRPATQLLLVIDSDLAPGSYQCIGVDVARLRDGAAVRPTQYVSFAVPAQADVPFSLGILPPENDAAVRIEIRAEARTTSCPDPNTTETIPAAVVRSVTRVGFASGQTLRLPMFLGARCTGVVCEEGSTCDPDTGACTPVPEQDPGELTPVTPGEEIPDASAPDASAPDAGREPDRVCPLQGNDYDALASGAVRAFGLAITEPSREWVVVYDDAGSLRAIRIGYDQGVETAAPAWTLAGGADAIALEGAASGDRLIALVNPTGTTDLVRHVGPIGGPVQTATVGSGRLVQRGRHSALVGDRIATVIDRGAGTAVIAIGADDAAPTDVYSSPSRVAVALGNAPSGDLLVAIEGTECEVRTYDRAGALVATATVAPGSGSTGCAPHGVTQLIDGRLVVIYGTETSGQARVRLSLYTDAAMQMSIRLSMGDDYASPIAAVLGDDESFRAAWVDQIDYPDVPGTDLMPGLVYWTNFAIGATVSEYTDHGDATTDHEQTRWERRGLRTALVMPDATGFRFRSICRPTD